MADPIDRIVDAAMRAGGLEGLTLGIAFKGETTVRAYGRADIENDVRATPHTVYRIGSLTKQFTAAAVLLLAERGALRLDDTLGTLIPEYPPHAHGITVEQLLSHTSGIRNYTEIRSFAERARLDSTQEQVARLFAAEPLDFEPGTRYRYSNSGYYLLGIIIERASGEPYYTFVHERLFAPLGLRQTYYLDDYRIIPHRAQGYDAWDGTPIHAAQISMTVPFSAGALGSTAPDLLDWQEALTTGRLISTDSYARMTTAGRLSDGRSTTYGFGVMIGGMLGHRKLSHAGTISGFRAQLAHYPDDRLTIALLSNNGHTAVEAIESRIARVVLEIAEPAVEDVALSAAELVRFAGSYEQDNGSPLPVTHDADGLTLAGAKLLATAPDRFIVADDPTAHVAFDDELVTIEREGQVTVAHRSGDRRA